MNLEALRQSFRVKATDTVAPYFWSDEAVDDWLNEGQEEACVRARLLHEVLDPLICRIEVAAGATVFLVNDAVINITRAVFVDAETQDETVLHGCTEYELDQEEPGWRKQEGAPNRFIHADTHLRINRIPPAGRLDLEVNRLPRRMTRDSDVPEISARLHKHLVDWALHEAFSLPDAETVDKNQSARAEANFERVFGQRPHADTLRSMEYSRPHANQSHW